ncbi:MAG: ferredoxin [Hyphomicrobiaceae bacterium]
MVQIVKLTEAVAQQGFRVRGSLRVVPDDNLPILQDGQQPQAIVLLGNAGPDMWQCFAAQQTTGMATLDAWTKDKLDPIAQDFGARAYYPFERPYLPFQRWAQRAEPVAVSPLNILVHPDYGLWHAYRAAFAFAEVLEPTPRDERDSPCETCADRPCLSACPVSAFANGGYAADLCARHVASAEGADCRENGCLARHACPVGRDFVYAPPQARFHMEAFLAAGRHVGSDDCESC